MAAMGAYARWRALTRREKRLILDSAAAVSVAVLGIRLFGLQRALRTASRGVAPRRISHDEICDRVTALDRASRYIPGGTCLPQSLALAWLLRRRGIPVSVRIGTRNDNGRFEAHAWVEYEGVAVNDAPPGYAALIDSSQFTVDSSKELQTANRKP